MCGGEFEYSKSKKKADSSSFLAKNCFSGRKGFFEVRIYENISKVR